MNIPNTMVMKASSRFGAMGSKVGGCASGGRVVRWWRWRRGVRPHAALIWAYSGWISVDRKIGLVVGIAAPSRCRPWCRPTYDAQRVLPRRSFSTHECCWQRWAILVKLLVALSGGMAAEHFRPAPAEILSTTPLNLRKP